MYRPAPLESGSAAPTDLKAGMQAIEAIALGEVADRAEAASVEIDETRSTLVNGRSQGSGDGS